MKMIFSKKPLLILFIFLFFGGMLFSQSSDRYFDEAEPISKEVRLAILYPSLGSINSLVDLRKQGLFPQKDLIVIGVYHEKERTN